MVAKMNVNTIRPASMQQLIAHVHDNITNDVTTFTRSYINAVVMAAINTTVYMRNLLMPSGAGPESVSKGRDESIVQSGINGKGGIVVSQTLFVPFIKISHFAQTA